MDTIWCLCLGAGAGPGCQSGVKPPAVSLAGRHSQSRIHPAAPGYNITVRIVSYRIAKHRHVCFTPPDSHHPGSRNHRAGLQMNREMHITRCCLCVYIETSIYIGTSTLVCMGNMFPLGTRGQIVHLLLTAIPQLPTKHVPAKTPCTGPQIPAKIPANMELWLPQEHLGSEARRGSTMRRSWLEEMISPTRGEE